MLYNQCLSTQVATLLVFAFFNGKERHFLGQETVGISSVASPYSNGSVRILLPVSSHCSSFLHSWNDLNVCYFPIKLACTYSYFDNDNFQRTVRHGCGSHAGFLWASAKFRWAFVGIGNHLKIGWSKLVGNLEFIGTLSVGSDYQRQRVRAGSKGVATAVAWGNKAIRPKLLKKGPGLKI